MLHQSRKYSSPTWMASKTLKRIPRSKCQHQKCRGLIFHKTVNFNCNYEIRVCDEIWLYIWEHSQKILALRRPQVRVVVFDYAWRIRILICVLITVISNILSIDGKLKLIFEKLVSVYHLHILWANISVICIQILEKITQNMLFILYYATVSHKLRLASGTAMLTF